MNDSPSIRARATFLWTPPAGHPGIEPGQFIMTLYDNDVVDLDLPAELRGIVFGLQWSTDHQAISSGGGFWDHKRDWPLEVRDHLLLRASNALRRELALRPHPATPNFPGTEA